MKVIPKLLRGKKVKQIPNYSGKFIIIYNGQELGTFNSRLEAQEYFDQKNYGGDKYSLIIGNTTDQDGNIVQDLDITREIELPEVVITEKAPLKTETPPQTPSRVKPYRPGDRFYSISDWDSLLGSARTGIPSSYWDSDTYRNMRAGSDLAALSVAGWAALPEALTLGSTFGNWYGANSSWINPLLGRTAEGMLWGQTADLASQAITGNTIGGNVRNFVGLTTGFTGFNPNSTLGQIGNFGYNLVTDLANPFYGATTRGMGEGLNYYGSKLINEWLPAGIKVVGSNPYMMAPIVDHLMPGMGSDGVTLAMLLSSAVPSQYPKIRALVSSIENFERSKGTIAPIRHELETIMERGTEQQILAIESAISTRKTLAIHDAYDQITSAELPALRSSSIMPSANRVAANQRVLEEYRASNPSIQWDAEDWFARGNRTSRSTDPVRYTEADVATFEDHIANEYIPLQLELIKTGKLREVSPGSWEGEVGGQYMKVDPRDYVVANSKAFKDAGLYYDGLAFFSGVPTKYLDSFMRSGGINAQRWASNNLHVGNTYGPRTGGKLFNLVSPQKPGVTIYGGAGQTSNHFHGKPVGDALSRAGLTEGGVGDALNYLDDLTNHYYPTVNAIGDTRVFMPTVPVKVLRGNNGNFDMSYPSPFAYNNQNDDNNINYPYA